MRPARAELRLAALRHNLAVVRRAVPGSRVAAAIKADGYGHGLLRVARALTGADALAVASIDEALALRAGGVAQPILLLEGFFHPDEIEAIASHDLTTVVHHWRQVEGLEAASPPAPIRVWIKVDSGMHRLGFPPDQVAAVWKRLRDLSHVVHQGFLTHLANADDRDDPTTPRQIECFASAVEDLPGERSIAHSAGILGWPGSHAGWVRPGIMLYGVSPFVGGRGAEEALQPVMTLRSKLMAVNRLKAGQPVGYGGTWVAPEEMPVGIVAIGYGDGYPRQARSGTPVLLNGRRVPLVGRVSMDMIAVDLRSQPGAGVGDPVVLWGEGLPVEEVAGWAGTIAYQLLCGVAPRVPRVEVG